MGRVDIDLDRDLPTTAADVEALRRLRYRPRVASDLLATLSALAAWRQPRSRPARTFAGWAEFVLDRSARSP